jgi:hypothetical protein
MSAAMSFLTFAAKKDRGDAKAGEPIHGSLSTISSRPTGTPESSPCCDLRAIGMAWSDFSRQSQRAADSFRIRSAALIVRSFYLTFATSTRGYAMSTLTVTAKGQVTLRKDILKHMGVHPGEKITVDKLPDGRIEMKAVRPTGKISDVFGLLKKENGPSLSIEEINEIAARGWAGRR